MSLTPQQASELLRERFRTMTEEEFIRLATKYSPTLLDWPSTERDESGPYVRVFSPSEALVPETLRQILQDIGFACLDAELAPMLRVLANRQVATVGDLYRLASDGRASLLREVFETNRATNARAFDFIACLVDASDAPTLSDFRARTITFLGILDEFERLQSAS